VKSDWKIAIAMFMIIFELNQRARIKNQRARQLISITALEYFKHRQQCHHGCPGVLEIPILHGDKAKH
jgi:hypothetical protein